MSFVYLACNCKWYYCLFNDCFEINIQITRLYVPYCPLICLSETYSVGYRGYIT